MGRFPEEAVVELRTEARVRVNQEKKGEWPRQRQESVGGGDRRRSWEDAGWGKDEKSHCEWESERSGMEGVADEKRKSHEA